jgi:hypothetical protein
MQRIRAFLRIRNGHVRRKRAEPAVAFGDEVQE